MRLRNYYFNTLKPKYSVSIKKQNTNQNGIDNFSRNYSRVRAPDHYRIEIGHWVLQNFYYYKLARQGASSGSNACVGLRETAPIHSQPCTVLEIESILD